MFLKQISNILNHHCLLYSPPPQKKKEQIKLGDYKN